MSLHPQVANAIIFAANAHGDQKRKYTNHPYITHTVEVAMLAAPFVPDVGVIAAVLHDTVEDTDTTLADIALEFGTFVADLVDDLTDHFQSAHYPEMNRAARKAAEVERLGRITPIAQTIKYADLISNSRTIVQFDPKFAKVYLPEKRAILEAMQDGAPVLRASAFDVLTQAEKELVDA